MSNNTDDSVSNAMFGDIFATTVNENSCVVQSGTKDFIPNPHNNPLSNGFPTSSSYSTDTMYQAKTLFTTEHQACYSSRRCIPTNDQGTNTLRSMLRQQYFVQSQKNHSIKRDALISDNGRQLIFQPDGYPVATSAATCTNNSTAKINGSLDRTLLDALKLLDEYNNDTNQGNFDNIENEDNISTISMIANNIEPNSACIDIPKSINYNRMVVTVNTITPEAFKKEENEYEDYLEDYDDTFTVDTTVFDLPTEDLPLVANYQGANSFGAAKTMAPRHNKLEATMVCLKRYMECSRRTQEMLQNWDEQNGLPRSHSVTMFRSNRSRRQLLEGRILPKWNGKPLIGNEPLKKKKTSKKKGSTTKHKTNIMM